MSPDHASPSPASRPPLPLTRRGFLGTGAMAGAALALTRQALLPLGAAEPAIGGPRSLAAHRNLFNGDCNFLFYNPELWQPEGGRYDTRAIERYLGIIADSGIDTLLINPNTQVAWYPSKKLEYLLAGYRRGDLAFARSVGVGLAGMTPVLVEKYSKDLASMLDLYLDVAEAGVDPVENAGSTIIVANASGVGGSAGRMSDLLEAAGFTVGTPTNSTAQASESVLYYDEAGANAAVIKVDADALAATLGGLTVLAAPADVPTDSGSLDGDILLVLGTNEADKTLAELAG